MTESDVPFHHRTQRTVYCGRNGTGKCLGIAFYVDREQLTINPLCTRGVANCSIDIPLLDLPALINALRHVCETRQGVAGRIRDKRKGVQS